LTCRGTHLGVQTTPDHRIAAIAAPQGGLLAIGQARAAGLTSRQICHRVDRGSLLRLGGGVLAIAGHELERRFLRLVRRAGLPQPTTQKTFRGERTIRVDAIWEDHRLVVEVMGHRFHCTAVDLQRDAQRRNELQAIGLDVLEFTAHAIMREPDQVIAMLRRRLQPPLM
jgi:very-short-patch-repair endonuclease